MVRYCATCPPTSALPSCLRHHHDRAPRPPLVNLSAISPPPWTTHKPSRHPTLTHLVTSFKKCANNPKKPYFVKFCAFFALFAKNIAAPSACVLRPKLHQPARNNQEIFSAPSHLLFRPRPSIYQVFVRANFSETWFFSVNAKNHIKHRKRLNSPENYLHPPPS